MHAKHTYRRYSFGANPVVGDEAHKRFSAVYHAAKDNDVETFDRFIVTGMS